MLRLPLDRPGNRRKGNKNRFLTQDIRDTPGSQKKKEEVERSIVLFETSFASLSADQYKTHTDCEDKHHGFKPGDSVIVTVVSVCSGKVHLFAGGLLPHTVDFCDHIDRDIRGIRMFQRHIGSIDARTDQGHSDILFIRITDTGISVTFLDRHPYLRRDIPTDRYGNGRG